MLTSGGSLLSELASALRRTMSPVRTPKKQQQKQQESREGSGHAPKEDEGGGTKLEEDEDDRRMWAREKRKGSNGSVASLRQHHATLAATSSSPPAIPSASSPSSTHFKRKQPSVKRKLMAKKSGEGGSASAVHPVPDIHPELTLEEVKAPLPAPNKQGRHLPARQSSMGESAKTLEINTMFDYSPTANPSAVTGQLAAAAAATTGAPTASGRFSRPKFREGRRSTWQYGASNRRRSSVAVMASTARHSEHQSLSYFPQSTRLKPQSSSAVHYLAISPPRIKITDDKGMTSPSEAVSAQRKGSLPEGGIDDGTSDSKAFPEKQQKDESTPTCSPSQNQSLEEISAPTSSCHRSGQEAAGNTASSSSSSSAHNTSSSSGTSYSRRTSSTSTSSYSRSMWSNRSR